METTQLQVIIHAHGDIYTNGGSFSGGPEVVVTMGWTSKSSWKSSQDVADEATKYHQSAGRTILKQALVKRCAGEWVLFSACTERKGTKSIFLDLIEVTPKGEYATKDLHEDCGPYYYGCPQELIDLVDPATNPNAIEWRRLNAIMK